MKCVSSKLLRACLISDNHIARGEKNLKIKKNTYREAPAWVWLGGKRVLWRFWGGQWGSALLGGKACWGKAGVCPDTTQSKRSSQVKGCWKSLLGIVCATHPLPDMCERAVTSLVSNVLCIHYRIPQISLAVNQLFYLLTQSNVRDPEGNTSHARNTCISRAKSWDIH